MLIPHFEFIRYFSFVVSFEKVMLRYISLNDHNNVHEITLYYIHMILFKKNGHGAFIFMRSGVSHALMQLFHDFNFR